jgi:hypothetical protein
MSSQELKSWLEKQIAHDDGAIVWLQRHLSPRTTILERQLLASPRFAHFNLPRIAPFVATLQTQRWQHDLRWFETSRRIAGARLSKLQAEIRAAKIRAALPAHLRLWRCIEVGESHGDGVHPGETSASNGSHFNVLQMTDPWYGIHPQGQSYEAIEAYAERMYAAYHYSRSWLEGQWGETIGRCWQYAS